MPFLAEVSRFIYWHRTFLWVPWFRKYRLNIFFSVFAKKKIVGEVIFASPFLTLLYYQAQWPPCYYHPKQFKTYPLIQKKAADQCYYCCYLYATIMHFWKPVFWHHEQRNLSIMLWLSFIFNHHQTTTCGAAISTAAERSTVKKVNAIKQTLSRTMAANFHSFSSAPASA